MTTELRSLPSAKTGLLSTASLHLENILLSYRVWPLAASKEPCLEATIDHRGILKEAISGASTGI
jgi:hypothetical protein